jgi:hypothetical protein
VPADIGQTVRVRSSLPQRVEPEITAPVVWTLSFFIPFALFEHYLGPLGAITGQASSQALHQLYHKPPPPRRGHRPARQEQGASVRLAGQLRAGFTAWSTESSAVTV